MNEPLDLSSHDHGNCELCDRLDRERAALLERVTACEAEALDFQAQAKRAGDRLQETINETRRWEDACEGLRKRVEALEGAMRQIGFEPIGDPEASVVQIYSDIVKIARAALR